MLAVVGQKEMENARSLLRDRSDLSRRIESRCKAVPVHAMKAYGRVEM
jgi:hypothetical protein